MYSLNVTHDFILLKLQQEPEPLVSKKVTNVTVTLTFYDFTEFLSKTNIVE